MTTPQPGPSSAPTSPTAPSPAFTAGSGPVRVVVVHGWMGGSHLFHPYLPHIESDKYTYAFVDCCGYGVRSQETGAMTIESAARDVLAIADSLDWPAFHVVGHSMGGMIAQRLFIDAPERILSAVLLASVPACGAKIDAVRRELLEKAIADPATRRELIDINTGRSQPSAWVDDLLALSLRSTSPAGMTGFLDAWTGTDFASRVKGATAPVLVLVGGVDAGTTAARMVETVMVWYPNAQLEIMEGVGHYAMQEKPAVLQSLISAFLDKVSADSQNRSR